MGTIKILAVHRRAFLEHEPFNYSSVSNIIIATRHAILTCDPTHNPPKCEHGRGACMARGDVLLANQTPTSANTSPSIHPIPRSHPAIIGGVSRGHKANRMSYSVAKVK